MARLGPVKRSLAIARGIGRWSMSKSARVFAWFLVIVGGTASAPAVVWHLRADQPMDVLIIDKTVALPDYREHRGLNWLLRHRKVVRPDTGAPLDLRDYAGYDPAADPPVIPVAPRFRSLDLAYVADTYGVYEDDLGIPRPAGDRSELVYGGVRDDEIRRLLLGLRPGATLIGEFNSLASPTRGSARIALGDALGVRWSGWIGRHFDELAVNPELPAWLPKMHRRNTGFRWRYRGPGYVFVSEDERLVVLDEGIDAASPGVGVAFERSAVARYGAQPRHVYDYWFDIVEPLPGTEVLASYEVALRRRGKRQLADAGLPTRFPAVLRREGKTHRSYYFAGDYADMNGISDAYRYTGIPMLRRMLQGGEARDDQTSFFWKVYEPMMTQIIREAAEAAARGRRERERAAGARSARRP